MDQIISLLYISRLLLLHFIVHDMNTSFISLGSPLID